MKPSTIAAVISMCFAVPALFVGLRAAWYWLKASEIGIDPGWNSGMPGDTRPAQPADTEGIGTMDGWLFATIKAARKSSDLNRTAAILTAYSVVLAGLSSVVGALAGFL
jgi:hypothetical protein